MIYFVISHPLIGVVIHIYLDCNLNYASQVIYININAIISLFKLFNELSIRARATELTNLFDITSLNCLFLQFTIKSIVFFIPQKNIMRRDS